MNLQQLKLQRKYSTIFFFSSDRYDLSDVGRVKLNSRLNLDCSDKITILRTDDVLAIIQKMLDLRDGKDEVDDIDHLGNRRVRSVGELVENQARIGVYRKPPPDALVSKPNNVPIWAHY